MQRTGLGLFQIFKDDGGSKIAVSPTSSTGVLPSGDIFRNQSGLSARSISIRSNSTPFSVNAITARCT